MNILLVRHGESTGNLDHKAYGETPDHDIPLTVRGHDQARQTGAFISDWFKNNTPQGKVRLWASPYRRTTETAIDLRENATDVDWDRGGLDHDIHFDARLREREWGPDYFEDYYNGVMASKDPEFHAHFIRTVQAPQGKYFARPRHGESVADITTRLYSFFQDLYFDINRGITDHVIVTHARAIAAFVFGFTKVHPGFMDKEALGSNCSVRLLAQNPATKRYADYGLIYDPAQNLYLLGKPDQPVSRDLGDLLKG